ncbi:hypothetical protein NPX79_03730 [Spiroplasma endosymbiont of Anurida maritima]
MKKDSVNKKENLNKKDHVNKKAASKISKQKEIWEKNNWPFWWRCDC